MEDFLNPIKHRRNVKRGINKIKVIPRIVIHEQ